MNVLILNDTSRELGHLGCELVMKNLYTLLEANKVKKIITIKDIDEKYDRDEFNKILENIDFVILNGEGTLHHDRGEGLFKRCQQAKDKNKKIYLINSVWQDNNENYKYLNLFNKIYVRESLSFQEIKKHNISNVKVVPDLLFYDIKKKSQLEISNRILVTDSVILEKTSYLLDAYLKLPKDTRFCFMGYWNKDLVKKTFYIRYVRAFFRAKKNMKCLLTEMDIMQYSFVLTGRFHAVCLCIKYLIPFLATQSNTHKIEGLLKDIGVDFSKYILNDIGGLDNKNIYLDNVDRQFFKKYSEDAQLKIHEMFQEIFNDFLDV
jgi:hypothetical protein